MKLLVAPDIEDYAQAHSDRESSLCRALREETLRTMEHPQMLVGPLEGAFLKMMVEVVQAKRVLEIGMFTGYSALAMAEALPEDGTILTCEVDERPATLARKYFSQSPHGKKVDIHMGPALQTLSNIEGTFELVFIDADKVNYTAYYQRALELLAPHGVILIDNVLWSGDVLKGSPPDESTKAIQELNRLVSDDPRVRAVLLTIRDGVFMIRKQI